MEKPKKKRKVRYWNAWAVIVTDAIGNPVLVESFQSREDASVAYTKYCKKMFGPFVSDIVADGCTLIACRSVTTEKCVRLVVNKVWKEGFE